jgi:drug/metabolite transporter (DMT)-like permease
LESFNYAERVETLENQPRIEYDITPDTTQQNTAPASNVLILGGALVAAVVGAVVWALIAYYGEYELGILASAIGALVGFVVAFLAKKNVTAAHQIIAVVFALVGVLGGKYLTYYLVKKDIDEQLSLLGADLPAGFEIDFHFKDMFELYDVLWIALAVVAAWTIPKRYSQS